MATDPNSDFQAFVHFVVEQQQRGVPLTPEEAVEQFRESHPYDDDEELIADVQEALDSMAAGDKGVPAQEALAKLRAEFGLSGRQPRQ
jgi:ATP-dependent exoDNAse (exonuclease V) beta subunit